MIGAGGGGFLLFYCPKEKTKLVAAMEKMGLKATWFAFEHEGVKNGFYN